MPLYDCSVCITKFPENDFFTLAGETPYGAMRDAYCALRTPARGSYEN